MRIGVIVGRFQVPELHKAHIDLINLAIENSDELIIFLGENEDIKSSPRNPLTANMRAFMIWDTFRPQPIPIRITGISDHWSDSHWSSKLDAAIQEMVNFPDDVVTLYGGRDSFLDVYEGGYQSVRVPYQEVEDGTWIRKMISIKGTGFSKDFREGVIWAKANRWNVVYPVVDVAIFDENWEKIILGRKKDNDQWQLIGGFADKGSESFEEDAVREAFEEAGVFLDNVMYLQSKIIDDWRYANEPDVMKSLLFVATTFNEVVAGDDIEEVAWWYPHEAEKIIIDNHKEFLDTALLFAHAMRTPIMDPLEFDLGPYYAEEKI